MTNFIAGFIVTVISILLGFYLGSKSEKESLPVEVKEKVKRLFKKIELKKEAIGAIERPNAKMISDYENPIKKAEEDEMSKLFSEIIKKE